MNEKQHSHRPENGADSDPKKPEKTGRARPRPLFVIERPKGPLVEAAETSITAIKDELASSEMGTARYEILFALMRTLAEIVEIGTPSGKTSATLAAGQILAAIDRLPEQAAPAADSLADTLAKLRAVE